MNGRKLAEHNKTKSSRVVLIALAIYIARVEATYVLEGRVDLLLRFDPIGRALYVSIANIIIGTIITFWALWFMLSSRFISYKQLGLRKSLGKTAATSPCITV